MSQIHKKDFLGETATSYQDCANIEMTLSKKLEWRIRELRVELIELEALKRILDTEPIIDKVFSGEQGRKLRQYL